MASSPFGNCPLCRKPVFAVKWEAGGVATKSREANSESSGPAYEFSPCGCRAFKGVEPACYLTMQDAVRKWQLSQPEK